MVYKDAIIQKVIEIKAELQRFDLWQLHAPAWVSDYKMYELSSLQDFYSWLQFVYLPNRLRITQDYVTEREYIVPQAVIFLQDDLQKGKILQLLIELDALT